MMLRILDDSTATSCVTSTAGTNSNSFSSGVRHHLHYYHLPPFIFIFCDSLVQQTLQGLFALFWSGVHFFRGRDLAYGHGHSRFIGSHRAKGYLFLLLVIFLVVWASYLHRHGVPQDCMIESSRLEDTKLEDIWVIDFLFLLGLPGAASPFSEANEFFFLLLQIN
ncbi:hypothetical protein GGI35DRAFT_395622 [Trichoderma velutinum]